MFSRFPRSFRCSSDETLRKKETRSFGVGGLEPHIYCGRPARYSSSSAKEQRTKPHDEDILPYVEWVAWNRIRQSVMSASDLCVAVKIRRFKTVQLGSTRELGISAPMQVTFGWTHRICQVGRCQLHVLCKKENFSIVVCIQTILYIDV